MRLTMGLGAVIGQSLRQKQAAQLTQTQRHLLAEHTLTLRLALIESLHDEKYEPKGDCPYVDCGRKMTPIEILRGFSDDPNDYTTECTGCHRRFEPKLLCGRGNNLSRVELPFFCSMQTLERMKAIQPIPAGEFLHKHPAIYRSAIFHHGGLRRAYEKIGVQYAFEEIHLWQRKVESFLGQIPDTVIAECVDKSVAVVRTLRKTLGIAPYNMRHATEAAGLA